MQKRAVIVTLIIVMAMLFSISAVAMEYQGPPMLAEQVDKGELPPVEERLPEEPLVVEPTNEIGQYGGTWKLATFSPRSSYLGYRNSSESLLKWDRQGTEPRANLAKEWEVSDDGRKFTFYVRKGVKWSDGEPFTVDDIMFWYEHVLLNKEISPSVSTFYKPAEEIVTVKKIDDYTITFEFDVPNPLFSKFLCFSGQTMLNYPEHYMKQFHPEFVSQEKVDEMAEEEDFDDWVSFFQEMAFRTNIELPKLNPWLIKTEMPSTLAEFERNPYYWKVDPEGKQLPYIDYMDVQIIQEREILPMKVMDGEINWEGHFISQDNFPMLKRNEDSGGYTVKQYDLAGVLTVEPNLTSEDPVMGPLIRDKRFRIALSIGVDREDINESTYLGMGTIKQGLPHENDPYAIPELESKDTEYDPQRANELLDEMGLDERNSDGVRLTPDGEPVSFVFSALAENRPQEAFQIIAEYWEEELDLDVTVKFPEASLWRETWASNEMVIGGYGLAGIHWDVDSHGWYVPLTEYNYFAPMVGRWVQTDGKSGVEPEGDIKKLIDTWKELQITADDEKRIELGREIVRLHSENRWLIGFVAGFQPVSISNDFRNWPDKGIQDYRLLFPSYLAPEQMWFEQ